MGKNSKSQNSAFNNGPSVIATGTSKDKSKTQKLNGPPSKAHMKPGSPGKQGSSKSSSPSVGNAVVVAVKQSKPTTPSKPSQASKSSKSKTTKAVTPPPLTPKSPKANSPRIDARSRVLARFYEPMILLLVLGKTRGEHQRVDLPNQACLDGWSMKHLRRLFLLKLAYLCDYEKGGDTVTALALEHKPERRTFWVAANTNPSCKIVPFLGSILTLLQSIATGDSFEVEGLRERLLRKCCNFAEGRLKTYARWLDQAILKAKTRLMQFALQDAKYAVLLPWLEQFRHSKSDYMGICMLAYETRKGPQMSILASLCKESSYGMNSQDASHERFRKIRHYIGRLAQHVSAVNRLVGCASRLATLLDEYDVRAIIPPSRSPRPLADGMTNLKSILNRMLPSDSNEAEHYQSALQDMDHRYSLEAEFVAVYTNPNFRPRVHAEVQLLDHFYSNTLDFEDRDYFIACSKPACYLCFKYFKHHPMNPVPPATHQTIHPYWAPLANLMESKSQRTILQKMTEEIRSEALQQIHERRPGRVGHPDSSTGITVSAMADGGNDDNSDLDVDFDDRDDQDDFDDLESDSESTLDDGNAASSSEDVDTPDMRLSERDILELDEGVPLFY